MKTLSILAVNSLCHSARISENKNLNSESEFLLNNYHGKFLYQESCGVTGGRQKRVINGTQLIYGTEPWLVNIYSTFYSLYGFDYICGGALISNRWVLSAGHCMHDEPAENLRISVGDHSIIEISNSSDDEIHQYYEKDLYEEIYNVENYFYHRNDTYDMNKDDVVLIKLEKEVVMSTHVEPACLPAFGDFIPQKISGHDCHVMGWGLLDSEHNLPETSRTASVKVFKPDECTTGCFHKVVPPNIRKMSYKNCTDSSFYAYTVLSRYGILQNSRPHLHFQKLFILFIY